MNDESTSSQERNSGDDGLHNKDFSKVYTRKKFRSPTEAEEVAPLAPVHESDLGEVDIPSASEIVVETPPQMICPLHYEKVHELVQECLLKDMGLNMI
jgi:hypothetical protein